MKAVLKLYHEYKIIQAIVKSNYLKIINKSKK